MFNNSGKVPSVESVVHPGHRHRSLSSSRESIPSAAGFIFTHAAALSRVVQCFVEMRVILAYSDSIAHLVSVARSIAGLSL